MGSISIRLYSDIINILWLCKIEIITGIFSALAIYSYFYDIKLEQKINIMTLKKKIKEVKNINPEINEEMSEARMEYLQNILTRIEKYMEKQFDKIEVKIDDIDDRVVLIEKNNAVTRREIALYVTIGVFVLIQILDKINVI